MKKMRAASIAALLLAATGVCALAGPVPIGPFLGTDFSALGAVSEAKPLLNSPYNHNDTFTGLIKGSVWNLSGGDYLYLYQAENSGPSVLEILVVSPFYGIKGVGYLTGGEPTGYISGGQTPVQYSGGYAVTYDATGGANVSFGYYSFLGGAVPGGGHTSVLYLISQYAPTNGWVSAINSGAASAAGWTTMVPEPASLVALGMGAAMLLIRRRTRM